MKNTYQKGAVGLIVIILILLAGGIGFYFYNSDRAEDAQESAMVEDESADVTETVDMEEPAGFEEDPMNLPAGDVQSGGGSTTPSTPPVKEPVTPSTGGGQPENPNIPVYTPEPVITATVGMKNFAFAPKTVTIKAGEAVEWVNDDYTNHTVTSNVTGSFDSGNLATGNNYVRTFTEAGTYTYYCKWHPNMTGTIIVE